MSGFGRFAWKSAGIRPLGQCAGAEGCLDRFQFGKRAAVIDNFNLIE
jgi:hypothetical protein